MVLFIIIFLFLIIIIINNMVFIQYNHINLNHIKLI